jgi:hypothetical protein
MAYCSCREQAALNRRAATPYIRRLGQLLLLPGRRLKANAKIRSGRFRDFHGRLRCQVVTRGAVALESAIAFGPLEVLSYQTSCT